MAAKTVTPRVHAMVLCDELEEREEEGVYNLLGVRTHIKANGLPYNHPQLCVYLQVTGHAGSAAFHLEVVSAATDDVLLVTQEESVPFQGPLEVLPIWKRIRNCSFPQAGVYYVQAYFDAKLANERLLIVSSEMELTNGQANGQASSSALPTGQVIRDGM